MRYTYPLNSKTIPPHTVDREWPRHLTRPVVVSGVVRARRSEDRLVAFIDIGTNAIRLTVVRVHADHHHTNVTQQREPVRLGEGLSAVHVLQPQVIDKAVTVCRKFAELAKAHGAEEIIAVATSATREAVNKDEFVHRLRHEAGLEVQVISGKEEARLIYQGLAALFHLGKKKALFVDIGGGSTEVAVGDQHDHSYLDSIKVGAVRLTALHLSPNEGLPVSPDTYQTLRHEARVAASNALNNIRLQSPELALGTAGTIKNLAAVSARTRRDSTTPDPETLTLAELRRVTAMLCALPLAERARVPGLNPDRADIIIGGAAILDVLLEETGFSELRVSTQGGLREGLLVDYMRRSSTGHRNLSVRERSALQLGRACKFDEPHARTAQRLALELFDSAKQAGLHEYGPWERELLAHAALLHDIGAFLSYTSHNLHSSYLIANTDTLLGFHQTEITIMSLTALFHRKGTPTAKVPAYAELDRDLKKLVSFLSLLLRLVESLDRSHQDVVRSVGLSAPDDHVLQLTVDSDEDVQLELWGIESRRRAVQKTLKRQLKIVLNGEPYENDFAREHPPEMPASG